MRKPKHKTASEKEPMLHDFDDLDQAPIFTISSKEKENLWDEKSNNRDYDFINNNLEEDEEFIEIHKLTGLIDIPLEPQKSKRCKHNLESESDSDDDSITSDGPSDDLEKTNAVCAAFTVVFLIILYFFELILMFAYLLSSSTDTQGQMIAQGLCKNFPSWQFMENMTDSWCDPRIFNRDFRLEVQCPCFVRHMFRNMTVY